MKKYSHFEGRCIDESLTDAGLFRNSLGPTRNGLVKGGFIGRRYLLGGGTADKMLSASYAAHAVV